MNNIYLQGRCVLYYVDVIRSVYGRTLCAPTEQAVERPETYRFARSKRACERIVIACGGVPARRAICD